jgi:hypothetical protein
MLRTRKFAVVLNRFWTASESEILLNSNVSRDINSQTI